MRPVRTTLPERPSAAPADAAQPVADTPRHPTAQSQAPARERPIGGLRRHHSEEVVPLTRGLTTPRALPPPAAAATPPELTATQPARIPAQPALTSAQRDFVAALPQLRRIGSGTRERHAPPGANGNADDDAAATAPLSRRVVALTPRTAAWSAAFAARCRRLAPELMDGDAPITAGAALVGPDGHLFDGARGDIAALRARLGDAPLVPCIAADDLLAWLAEHADADRTTFADAAADILRSCISLEVPPHPVTAPDGVTYGAGELALHLARLEHERPASGNEPFLPMSRTTHRGPLPKENRSLAALISRLGLASAESVAADARQRAEAECLAHATAAAGNAAAVLARSAVTRVAEWVLTEPSTEDCEVVPSAYAFDAWCAAFGYGDGCVAILSGRDLQQVLAWQAYDPSVAGGVAAVALLTDFVATLSAAPASPSGLAPMPTIWTLDGRRTQQIAPTIGPAITDLGTLHGSSLRAVQGERLLTWPMNVGNRRLSCAVRRLPDGARVGLTAQGYAVAGGGRIESVGPHVVQAGPLGLDPTAVVALVPCRTSVRVLDTAGKVHAYHPQATPDGAWAHGWLAPQPGPAELNDTFVTHLTGTHAGWATADSGGKVTVFDVYDTALTAVDARGRVHALALHEDRLLVVSSDADRRVVADTFAVRWHHDEATSSDEEDPPISVP